MSAVVQHTSTGAMLGSISQITLVFNNPVTAGNLIIAFAGAAEADVFMVSENGDQFTLAVAQAGQASIYYMIAPSSGVMTVVANFNITESYWPGYLHIFEVQGGYTTLDATGSVVGVGTGAAFPVSTSAPTAYADEFVFAAFANDTGQFINPQVPNEGAEDTNSPGAYAAMSEGFEVTTKGTQTVSLPSTFDITYYGVIATFYNPNNTGGSGGSGGSSGGGASPNTPFLGSVVLGQGNPPAGIKFSGTVKVIASPPSGDPNSLPFLGTIYVRNSGVGVPGNAPYLGEVLEVAAPPSGTNPIFGEVDTA